MAVKVTQVSQRRRKLIPISSTEASKSAVELTCLSVGWLQQILEFAACVAPAKLT